VLLLLNICRYRRAPKVSSGAKPFVSILIPARNEQSNIAACVKSALQSRDADIEVLVLDDHSSDATPKIVQNLSARDPRVRLLHSLPLPDGWCGKQFACHQLSHRATAPILFFIDADVRLMPDAVARSARFLERSGADLVSGVPRQITETFSEKLLIPLIHFVLLGFLPFGMMRRFRSAAFAAGCGQFFVARAESYERAGGHQCVKGSGHDGIELPRAFRKRGFKTDLFDPTDLASCRMYDSGSAVWNGLAKNAVEGIAKPSLIIPFSILFFFGHVLPPALLLYALATGAPAMLISILGVGIGMSYAARTVAKYRFAQSWLGVWLHPIALLLFLGIQWWALYQDRRGRPILWKGRPQPRLAS
jgi:glycosyltransferase involved in cell wall biosynthesis